MNKFLIMFIFCILVQSICSKSLFDYNINPKYDLVAQESAASYSNYWPSSEFLILPQIRYKHHARGKEHGRSHRRRQHEPPAYASGLSDGYYYSDSSEDYDYFDEPHHFHHPHGLPPGQAKQHGQPHSHPHVIPPRFPPPPVYDKNFLNPWTLSAGPRKPFIGQQPPLSTPQPFFEHQPPNTTPAVYVAPKFSTTTSQPQTTTEADDDLMYDIDVRFGRD